MRLPNYASATVPRAKVVDYLLSDRHPDGQSKARFFRLFGFSADGWETLAHALRRHAADLEVTKIEDTPFGSRYIIDGPLRTPDGRNPIIRSVWFLGPGAAAPRFVTAHPLKRRTT